MIRKERLIAILQKLVQARSENPPGNETGAAKIVERIFFSAGLKVKTISFSPGRPNVIGVLKGKDHRAPLLLVAHLDTVPAGSGWKHPPFGGKIQGGRLYGRGATDDKCHVALLAELAASIVEDKAILPRDVIFLAMADEEMGGTSGLIPLLEKKLIPASEAVLLDSSGFKILVAQKGLLHMKAEIFGKKAHGAYPSRGRNAIEDAAKIIIALKQKKIRCTNHPLLGPQTINIGTISGGERVNVVADKCEFEIDARFPPPATCARMEAHIRNVIKSKTKNYSLLIESRMEPVHTDPESKLVRALFSSIHSVGRKPEISGSAGSTLMALFIKHRMPCVSVGFGAEGTEHAADEYVNLSDVFDGTRAIEHFVKNYADTGK